MTAKVTVAAKPAKPAKPAAKKTWTTTTARTSSKASATKSSKAKAATPKKALTAKQKAQLHQAHEAHLAHLAHEAHLKAIGQAPKSLARAGDYLPLCAFEAVAQSLRLAGARVHGDDVAELWHLLGEPADGVPVGEALAAAALFGLAGYRPSSLAPLSPCPVQGAPAVRRGHAAREERPGHAVILGIDVPGPHAVLATADDWWSWGERFDPWPCRVDQAWAVSWS